MTVVVGRRQANGLAVALLYLLVRPCDGIFYGILGLACVALTHACRLTNAELRALIGQTDLTDDELTALATRLAVLA